MVDDAVVMRKLISEALSRDPAVEVAGVAASGRIALQKMTQVNPDIVTIASPTVVCVGTSTGGPNALAEVFKNFPPNFALPILIVQHMPPVFTAVLAERLTALGSVKCHEGAEGQTVEAGHAYGGLRDRQCVKIRFDSESWIDFARDLRLIHHL